MTWLTALRRRLSSSDDLAQLVRDTVAESASAGLRLIPIVDGERGFTVAALLARGELDDAAQIVPAISWVPAQPRYG